MKKVKTINCEEAIKNLLVYLDEQLAKGKSREVKHHLSVCRSCYSRSEFEKKLKSQLLEAGKEKVRPSLEKRIKALLKKY